MVLDDRQKSVIDCKKKVFDDSCDEVRLLDAQISKLDKKLRSMKLHRDALIGHREGAKKDIGRIHHECIVRCVKKGRWGIEQLFHKDRGEIDEDEIFVEYIDIDWHNLPHEKQYYTDLILDYIQKEFSKIGFTISYDYLIEDEIGRDVFGDEHEVEIERCVVLVNGGCYKRVEVVRWFEGMELLWDCYLAHEEKIQLESSVAPAPEVEPLKKVKL